MTICVVLLTYNRLNYAKRALAAAAVRLESNDHAFKWHIASDGDTPEYITMLKGVAESCGLRPEDITITNANRGGYGKNYNLAMQVAHQSADIILPLEDDWELLKPFNPDQLIHDMRNLAIGCARLGYIGYTQELRGVFAKGRAGHWLMFDPASPEPHVFAGHPRLELVQWSRDVGPWREGMHPGETEFDVAHRRAARQRVGWPLDVVRPVGDLFAHIGTERSY